MKISYNWLKDYIDFLPSPEETSEILTGVGLEVESVEEYSSIKGGLDDIVIGEVKSCEKHPDADRLTLTTVDIGRDKLLTIVCGAPNVEKGQKVPVAVEGAVLYSGKEPFTIKKTKIRGQVSEGMICAEDELGLGTDHSGIMVLNPAAKPGTPASEYFKIYKDTVFEVGITPNRIDGASHIGAARDLTAFFINKRNIVLKKPDVSLFKQDNNKLPVEVKIEDNTGCLRYSGVTISNVDIKPSPVWLQNRLKAVGLNPVNNVVDITNYVLHETGQPLHAFDASRIIGNKVIIKTLPEGTPFITLDEKERMLSSEDLMICNEKEGMCIAGVFGGLDSGVTQATKSIFLESACFNPGYIRKTSKRHMLNTDSSFHFERGSDPEITVYALKRAAILIKEIAGGEISSEIIDIYREPVPHRPIFLYYRELRRLTGIEIEPDIVKNILRTLDFKISADNDEGIDLLVPPYRVDVFRPADVIEEIIRIYGLDKIPVDEKLNSCLTYIEKPDKDKILNIITNLLVSNGFTEIMSNSLTKSSYFEQNADDPGLVKIYNPLSSDLNAMRKTLLFGGLEAIEYNSNRQNPDLRIFEFGNVYSIKSEGIIKNNELSKYQEEERLSLFITGEKHPPSWASPSELSNFFQLKAYVELVLKRLGYNLEKLEKATVTQEYLTNAYIYRINSLNLVVTGNVNKDLIRKFDIRNEVFFADFYWGNILNTLTGNAVFFKPLPRYPEVRRDLSMILEKSVKYEDIKQIALRVENKILRKINLFDVYEGDRIEKGKKSYAISFTLRDDNKTLTDDEIDNIMNKIAQSLEKEFGAQIRS